VSRELPRLLGGKDRLSRPEKEQIFERVLARTLPVRPSLWVRARLGVVGLAASAAVALLVVSTHGRSPQPELVARGVAQPSFRAACRGGRCRPGDQLVFEVTAPEATPYFAAFAQRSDGLVIWYFPDAPNGVSLDARGALLQRAVVIGPEHTAGDYQIYGVLSSGPLGRAELRRLIERDPAAAVRQPLRVQP
jgi:hypothetical protein